MALKKEIKTEHDIICTDAYILVESIEWYKNNQQAMARVLVFASKEAREKWAVAVLTFNVRFDYDLNSTQNIIKQAYAQIKLMPEYSDSVNV